jgi:hypothetical protein
MKNLNTKLPPILANFIPSLIGKSAPGSGPVKLILSILVSFVVDRIASKDDPERDTLIQDIVQVVQTHLTGLFGIFIAFVPQFKDAMADKVGLTQTVVQVFEEQNVVGVLGPDKADMAIDIVLSTIFAANIFVKPNTK